MSNRVRPWFSRTVYDQIKNLSRTKQLIPFALHREMEVFPAKLGITEMTANHSESWAKLFPRKVQVWESRSSEPSEPKKFDSSIFLKPTNTTDPVRPIVSIKSPQMNVNFPPTSTGISN